MKNEFSVFGSFRRRKKRWLFFLLVLVLLIIGAVWGWHANSSGRAPTYLTEPVIRTDLVQSVLASGKLEPIRTVDVGAQVSGQLKHLWVELGQEVKKGQLLAEIDPKLAQSELQIAQADLDDLRAQAQGVQVRLRQAEQEVRRQQVLQPSGASSVRERQQAETDQQRLLAEHQSLLARMQRARHVLAQQRTRLAYTRIEAPMDGEVLSIETREGQTVIAAQQAPTILKLGDRARIRVQAAVSEANIMQVRPGQRAWFTLLGDPAQRYDGQVAEILPTPEKINNAVFFTVRFDVENPRRLLRNGMTAEVTIVLAEARQVVAVPLLALQDAPTGTGQVVRVVARDGTVRRQGVAVGLRGRTHAQVLTGLQPGDQVMTADAATPVGKGDVDG